MEEIENEYYPLNTWPHWDWGNHRVTIPLDRSFPDERVHFAQWIQESYTAVILCGNQVYRTGFLNKQHTILSGFWHN